MSPSCFTLAARRLMLARARLPAEVSCFEVSWDAERASVVMALEYMAGGSGVSSCSGDWANEGNSLSDFAHRVQLPSFFLCAQREFLCTHTCHFSNITPAETSILWLGGAQVCRFGISPTRSARYIKTFVILQRPTQGWRRHPVSDALRRGGLRWL